MLLTLSDILSMAQKHSYAVLAPDFFNLDFAQIVLDSALEKQAPLILSYCHTPYNTFELDDMDQCIGIIRDLCSQYTLPIALHLDHAENIETIHKYLDLGFSSVMIDASTYPFEENIRITQQVVELARAYHASVEAELGHVGNGNDYLINDPNVQALTNLEQVQEFIQRTNVDALAISIGTQHGFYKGTEGLHLDLLEKIANATSTPLVLHGTSGTDHRQLEEAVKKGIRKLNIFTELFAAYQQSSSQITLSNLEDVTRMISTRHDAVFNKLTAFYKISGSIGRAKDFYC